MKELAAVVGGGLACRTVARQMAGLVPAVGWAVKAGVGYAGTWAMGMAAAEYFEHGGNMAGVGAVVDEARAAASRAADETAAGRAAKGFVASLGLQAKNAATGRVRAAVAQAPGVAAGAMRAVANAAASAAQAAATGAARAGAVADAVEASAHDSE